jgi:hypothetical protein
MRSFVNVIITFVAVLVLVPSLSATARADTPKLTEAEVRAQLEAQVLAKAQVKCAKEGKVALAQHVGGTFMATCVLPDDPEYKAQQTKNPAQ